MGFRRYFYDDTRVGFEGFVAGGKFGEEEGRGGGGLGKGELEIGNGFLGFFFLGGSCGDSGGGNGGGGGGCDD